MARISQTPPDVKADGWYNTTEAIEKLGMPRTTFWRRVKAGLIKGRLRKMDGNLYYQGRELTRAWNAFY